jgi:hypothetical protein
MTYYNNIINIWTKARTETYAWNETAPEPRIISQSQIFQSIRSYVFVAWFPDMSVAIRICLLACFYNLKANRNQFSKYFEVYTILKDDCTEQLQNGHSLQSKCEMRKWKHVLCDFSIPPPLALGLQFSMGHVTSVHQGLCSTRGKSLGTRLWPI